MSKHIDDEIYELEQRISRRRHSLEYTARRAKNTAVRKLMSPLGLISAAGIGLVATLGLTRRKTVHVAPAHVGKAGRLAGIASVLASVAFSVLRAQFGSPAQIAQMLMAKFQKSRQPAQYNPQYNRR
jgi:hypothetical protein